MKKKLILLLVVLVINGSILFTNARYKSTKSGTASIQTATFSVSQTGNKNSITLTGGGTEQTYTITIQNNSEVDLKYSILLTNIPNDVEVKLDSGSYVTVASNKVTFSNVGTISYGQANKSHTLTFKTPMYSDEVSNKKVNVNVEFVQKLN